MLFASYLVPDRVLASFRDVTPEMIRALGARAVLTDIDNTLATYDDADPPEEVVLWCRRMADAGIAVVLLSNNSEARVSRFAEPLGVPAFAKAGKPSVRPIRQALSDIGCPAGEAVALGDQLLTDVWGARRAGLRAALIVPPIKDKTTLFFRFKRLLEVPYMKQYYKRMEAEK